MGSSVRIFTPQEGLFVLVMDVGARAVFLRLG